MSGHLKQKLYLIIFESDTPAGRLFDVVLLWTIILSVLTVVLESMASIRTNFGEVLKVVEWCFTLLFTVEYVLRVYCSQKPTKYIFSFFGLVDLLALLPTYLSVVITGTHYFIVVRTLRLLRVFRVLKLVRYLGEAQVLLAALRSSRHKITVFLGAVFAIVIIMGALMYLIEGEEHGFTSIPRGMYWAVVTLTTVGYGDITPQTPLGQALSALVMIMGYGIIAVPTGIVSAELTRAEHTHPSGPRCSGCERAGHAPDASYCKYCGVDLAG